jgi:hypothetical protein
MAEFSVNMVKIPKLEIRSVDVIFHVQQDKENLGSLRVSKGALVWTPANKVFSYWLDWDKFSDMAGKQGQRRKAHY